MSPKEIVSKWVETFNQADAILLGEFYHDNAINHQVNTDAVIGKAAIVAIFQREFSLANMVCIIENIFEDGEWAILEWKDPLGLRGCGIFQTKDDKIIFQRGYWDKLSFLKMHNLPIPQ